MLFDNFKQVVGLFLIGEHLDLLLHLVDLNREDYGHFLVDLPLLLVRYIVAYLLEDVVSELVLFVVLVRDGVPSSSSSWVSYFIGANSVSGTVNFTILHKVIGYIFSS